MMHNNSNRCVKPAVLNAAICSLQNVAPERTLAGKNVSP